jgi:hypothetical protein
MQNVRVRSTARDVAHVVAVWVAAYHVAIDSGRGPADELLGPGKFWSGDALQLVGDARLGAEIRVDVPTPMRQLTP